MNTKKKIYGDVINRNILKYIKDNSSILDMGCGSGAISERLVKKGCKVYGIDIAEDAVQEARDRMTEVIVGDIERIEHLPWEKRFFDIIILADVLEHLKDPLNVLVKLKSYLKDEWIFLISLPNIAFWRIRLALLLGRFNYSPDGGIMDETHLRFFTFASAKRLINRAGLKIRNIDIPLPVSYNSFLSSIKFKMKKLFPSLLSHGMIFMV